MRNNQLTFARQYRGFTQTELAKQIPGLSQSNLSSFEKGLGSLSDDVIKKIMIFLNFPMEFLEERISNVVQCKHYRKKSNIKASDRDKIDRFISLVAYCFDWMADFVDLPGFEFDYIDLCNGYTPEDVALGLRRKFKLGIYPVQDIFSFLERNGVFVYLWDCEYDEFDGVSLITDKGNHIIIINGNMSNDRVRFSLAHELGHIIMHQCFDFIIFESRDLENEAHRFAAEFLMPAQGIKSSLFNLKSSQLPTLKKYWLTSMSSIMYRAKNLNQINERKYLALRNDMSRNSWLKKEPYEVYIDRPSVIQKIYGLITDTLGYNNDDITSLSHIPKDVIENIFNYKSNVISLRPIALSM